MARVAKTKKTEKKASSSSSSSSDWANLPGDLLGTILEKLFSLSDYIRFSVVCKPWKSIALAHKEKRMCLSNHQLPWKLVSALDEDGKERICLCNYLTAQISNFKLRIPNKYSLKSCCSYSHGWLFFLEQRYSLIIINPLSGALLKLPNLTCRRFPRNLWKNCALGGLVLSKDPCLGSFEILTTNYNQKVIVHLKFGDEFCSYSERSNIGQYFKCVGFYKDYKLAVCKDGNVSLEVNKTVMVRRYPSLKDFTIYKTVNLNGRFNTFEVRNLDGHSLFMGNNNHPIMVLASNYPGCRPDSVYYSLAYGTKGECCFRNVIKFYEFDLEDENSSKVQSVQICTETRGVVPLGELPWIVEALLKIFYLLVSCLVG